MAFLFKRLSVCALILCVALPTIIHASNILILPFSSEGSHYFVMKAIADELVSRGHHITMLHSGNFEEEMTSQDQDPGIKLEFFKPNLSFAEMHNVLENMTNAGLRSEYNTWLVEFLQTDFFQKQVSECRGILTNAELMSRLMNSNFELAMSDFHNQCPLLQYLRETIGLPYVVVSPCSVSTVSTAWLIGNRFPSNPAYMPEFTTGLDHHMTFHERLDNAVCTIVTAYIALSMGKPYEEIMNEFGIPGASVLHADAELWLMNTHFAFDFPRPFLPNTIQVGGLLTRPAKALPSDFEEFLKDAADDGVVLFSMGSYAKGIDENIAAMFAGAFAQVPQRIIWKLNGKPSATLTPNVKVVDWMPQNDLLGHPQVKAFVTHCGMNGIWEAVYHGVPMVAIPLFADQPDNAQRIVSRGIGVRVDISTLTSDELAKAIRTVVSDPSYKSNATRLSAIFRDTPRKPIELAADWSEYVIRHGGAKHLRSAALDLNVFQYFLLDVILVISLAFITFCVTAICLCRLCFKGCRKVCGSSSKVKTQ